ncbi:MAG: metal-dependent hydrolase [Proteobacteria bacterium]|nr:MAG: metal-dependent hydrolase [Pseudomonadota bacterium]
MASVVGHSIFATMLSYCGNRGRPSWLFLRLAIYSALIPDLDVLGFKFGIPYDSIFGHRGFSHSILFAIIIGLTSAAIFKRFDKEKRISFKWAALLFTVSAVSHTVLDAMTNGGHGVAFFSPFSNARFFLPWRPIEVSPIAAAFFSERGLEVVKNEALWIGLPCLVLVLIFFLVFQRRKKRI